MTRAQTISTLWIVVMFNMVFADIFSFMVPEMLTQIATGVVDGVEISVSLLLISAAIVQVPIAMIFMTKHLARKGARVANLFAVALTIVFVVGGGSTLPHYILFAGIEIAVMLWIAALAWTWPIEN